MKNAISNKIKKKVLPPILKRYERTGIIFDFWILSLWAEVWRSGSSFMNCPSCTSTSSPVSSKSSKIELVSTVSALPLLNLNPQIVILLNHLYLYPQNIVLWVVFFEYQIHYIQYISFCPAIYSYF